MTLKEAAESQVDTVSGVTLTSRTVIDNLKEVLKDPAMPPVQRVQGYRKIVIPLAEGLLLLFGLFSFFNKNLRKFRTPFLITLIAVFGFAGGDFISLSMLRGYLTGAVPFLGNPILWILLILSLVLPLITNKAFYCSQLCPFGALQELAGKIPFPPRKVPLHLRRYLSSFRTLLFGVLALIIIMDYSLDLSLVEPFAAFLYTVAAPITLVLAMVSLVLSLFYRKPWCRWFCPTGQFLEYLRSDQ
jgi:NosR/NirI family nitrous oxide reductase transcriptional regulator